ncbi:hypothetical protein D3C73_433320 [compost metagenome]
MTATRKITAPSKSWSSRPVCPTRYIITAPIITVRVRAPNNHHMICSTVCANCSGASSIGGAGSHGLKPSWNNSALYNEKMTSRASTFQVYRWEPTTRHITISIRIKPRPKINGRSENKDSIWNLQFRPMITALPRTRSVKASMVFAPAPSATQPSADVASFEH